jgi:hypothetical protein
VTGGDAGHVERKRPQLVLCPDPGFSGNRFRRVVRKFAYPGLLDFGVEVDTELADWWKGGTFYVDHLPLSEVELAE